MVGCDSARRAAEPARRPLPAGGAADPAEPRVPTPNPRRGWSIERPSRKSAGQESSGGETPPTARRAGTTSKDPTVISVRRRWASGRTAIRRRIATVMLRIRQRGRSAAFRAARITGASVAAYLVAEALGLRSPPPLIAALTALLVVQATLSGTLTNGVQRVLSVVAGVALAMLFVAVVGLTWWSLAALVAASIVVGQLLRLGPHLVEVPISAMLVLGVGYAAGAQSTGYGRVIETVIGAVVGVLVNVLFPPPVQSRHAGQAVARLAEESAVLLEEAATQLPTGPSSELTARWLEDARRLNRHVPRVDQALTHAEESRRLNVRALGAPRSTRSLRGGLESLELCSVATRTLFRSVHDWVRAGMPEPDERYSRQARSAWAELLAELAVVVRAFGQLLRVEVEGAPSSEAARLNAALDRLQRSRTRWDEVLLVDPHEHLALWELNAAVVALVDRMLLAFDTAEHVRLWQDRRRQAALRRAAGVVEKVRPTRRHAAEERPPADRTQSPHPPPQVLDQ